MLAVPDFSNPYRTRMIRAVVIGLLPERVPTITSLLRSLLQDIDAGLVGTLVAKVQAETFDSFLDHAQTYGDRRAKDQAGVIVASVFEDTVRKIQANKVSGVTRGRQLDELISELTKNGIITERQSRQARTAAFVRTKASHAEWEAFDLDGVDDTIKITRTLLKDHLM